MSTTERDELMAIVNDDALAALAARLFNPQRAALSAVYEVISGISDPAAAWKILGEKNIVPAELLAAPNRRFGMVDTSRRGLYARARGETRYEYPPTMESVVAFAADAGGIQEAEDLAIELARVLVPWGGAEITSFEWFCLSHTRPLSMDLGYPFDSAYNSLEYALNDAGYELDKLRADHPSLLPFLNRIARAHLGWGIAVDEELEVPSAYWPPSAIKWHPFAELTNPFPLTLSLYGIGYHLGPFPMGDDTVMRFYTFRIDAPPAHRPGQQQENRGTSL